jgi:L-methionine (R)-S-oxide reductase
MPKKGVAQLRKCVANQQPIDKGIPMYTYDTDKNAPKAQIYADLLAAARAITEGEADAVANMANISSLLWQFLPDLNWAGFYRMVDGELVLGPFQGKAACIRIPLGKGVCGAAAQSGKSQCVPDVHAFPGHIACDGDSRSELVVPVFNGDTVIAVIDLDSPLPGRFDSDDTDGIEQLAKLLGPRLA